MSENNEIKQGKRIFRKLRELPENNQVRICGIIEEEFEYDFKSSTGVHCETRIRVRRFSNVEDFVPIIVPVSLIKGALNTPLKGKYVEVTGTFCSHRERGKNGQRHLRMYLYPTAITIYDGEEEVEWQDNRNEVYLEGYITRKPILKTTTMTKKMVAETVISVKRFPNKIDRIPLVFWGTEAVVASEMEPGDSIKIYGRIQSREYFKSYSPNSEEGEYKTFYEVAVKQTLEP